jgi:AcrR family transcriptional regulator
MHSSDRKELEAQAVPRGTGRPARDENEFLDAAAVMFARNGLEGSSMEDLAAAANTTKPTLYARFGSKDELYERVVRREADAFIENVLASYEAAKTLPIHDTIEKPMAAWFQYIDQHPGVLQLLFAPDRSTAAQRIADEVEERIVDGLALMVEQALARSGRSAPPQSRYLATMVFGATLHATRHNTRARDLTISRAVALSTSFIGAGYRGLDAGLLTTPPPEEEPGWMAEPAADGRPTTET